MRAFCFSGERGNFRFGVEMFWAPAEVVPRLGAAQALIECVALGPVTEFSRNRVGGDDRRLRSARLSCEGARDASDLAAFDRRADIA